jgi:hypothetical protein
MIKFVLLVAIPALFWVANQQGVYHPVEDWPLTLCGLLGWLMVLGAKSGR